MSSDLVAFLRARLDEDAQTARDTAAEYGAVWTVDDGMGSVRSDTGGDVVEEPGTPRAHIARHDPARVLAEVEAKRGIVDHIEYELSDAGGSNPWWYADKLTPILEGLAVSYADHPDYRPEWRPEP